jgi:hypothetical protein
MLEDPSTSLGLLVGDQGGIFAGVGSSIATIATTTAATVTTAVSAMISPEPIHALFSVATFAPQPFFLLMILFPTAKLTKRIMGGLGEWFNQIALCA